MSLYHNRELLGTPWCLIWCHTQYDSLGSLTTYGPSLVSPSNYREVLHGQGFCSLGGRELGVAPVTGSCNPFADLVDPAGVFWVNLFTSGSHLVSHNSFGVK